MVTSLRFSLAFQTLNTETLLQSGILLKMSTLNIYFLGSENDMNCIYINKPLQAKVHLNYTKNSVCIAQ